MERPGPSGGIASLKNTNVVKLGLTRQLKLWPACKSTNKRLLISGYIYLSSRPGSLQDPTNGVHSRTDFVLKQQTSQARTQHQLLPGETPADQDQWRESDDVMNLFFNLDYNTDNKNSNIASATLRLYRLPQNITNRSDAGAKDDCKNNESVEEERLLRVSAYWYAKLQKKRRVKRRLSDSKVVPETSRWVELSVKPATKSWTKAGGRMLGLGILVEDQEGKPLRADKYFKGPSCTVGVRNADLYGKFSTSQ
ncbi:hypothetical protein D910_05026 [Dendroctonus ponderosae]